MKAFGRVVRTARKEQGLSQEGLALIAGVDRTFVGAIEAGTNQPTLLTMFRLTAALEFPCSELLQRVEKAYKPTGSFKVKH